MTPPKTEPLDALVESLNRLTLQLETQNRLILELVEQNGDLIQMQLQKDDEEPQVDLAGKPLFVSR